jgi:hypothetical protein
MSDVSVSHSPLSRNVYDLVSYLNLFSHYLV